MKERTKNQKGITLIALIITIVVLMILAAVAINSITNEGILSQAESTANQYTQEQLREQIMLQDYEDMLTLANGGTFAEYTAGQEVTVGNEPFYVIKDSAKTEAKVVLLAKLSIDTEKLIQSSTANKIAFAEEPYWPSDGSLSYYDLIETGVPDASHYAARAAYDYGLKVGGKGRLMRRDEAYDIYWDDETTYYWLGTLASNGTEYVCEVDPVDGIDANHYSATYGVRPVVEISKSKVTKVQ